MRKMFFLVVIAGLLSGCATPQPRSVDNVCSIFSQYPDWYRATKAVEQRWEVPIPVQMAILNQESSFVETAAPPRTYLFGFMPWSRPTTAYGYSQALNMTWRNYQIATGRWHANRRNFSDAVDFMGWYSSVANRRANVSPAEPFKLYLAYHEGVGGYLKKTYLLKPWLIRVAHKVSAQAAMYRDQLRRCESDFSQRFF